MPAPLDFARERRVSAALGEIRALLDSGAVEASRTAELLAGVLGRVAVEDTATTLRLSVELLQRAEALAEEGLGTGARVSRSVVLRRALELGLDALEGGVFAKPDEDVRADIAEIRARLAALERGRE